MSADPLISCICITRNRPALLNRAIECFNAQVYKNKELVILYEEDDANTAEYLSKNELGSAIKLLSVPRNKENKLGYLRNYAIEHANGEYMAQWDDDDWYHSHRLQYQYNTIASTAFHGCVLTCWLMFDDKSGAAYISPQRLWEGSLLCKRKTIRELGYGNQAKAEDTPVIDALHAKKLLGEIRYTPHLYIYNFHGENTWNYTHFSRFINHGKALPKDIIDEIKKISTEEYTAAQGSKALDKLSSRLGRLSKPLYRRWLP